LLYDDEFYVYDLGFQQKQKTTVKRGKTRKTSIFGGFLLKQFSQSKIVK